MAKVLLMLMVACCWFFVEVALEKHFFGLSESMDEDGTQVFVLRGEWEPKQLAGKKAKKKLQVEHPDVTASLEEGEESEEEEEEENENQIEERKEDDEKEKASSKAGDENLPSLRAQWDDWQEKLLKNQKEEQEKERKDKEKEKGKKEKGKGEHVKEKGGSEKHPHLGSFRAQWEERQTEREKEREQEERS